MGKHLEQALPSVYTLQCLTGKVDNNNNNKQIMYLAILITIQNQISNYCSVCPAVF